MDYLTREDLVARLARLARQINFERFSELNVDHGMYMINYFMYLKMDMKVKDEVKFDIDEKLWECFGHTFKEMTGYTL